MCPMTHAPAIIHWRDEAYKVSGVIRLHVPRGPLDCHLRLCMQHVGGEVQGLSAELLGLCAYRRGGQARMSMLRYQTTAAGQFLTTSPDAATPTL